MSKFEDLKNKIVEQSCTESGEIFEFSMAELEKLWKEECKNANIADAHFKIFKFLYTVITERDELFSPKISCSDYEGFKLPDENLCGLHCSNLWSTTEYPKLEIGIVSNEPFYIFDNFKLSRIGEWDADLKADGEVMGTVNWVENFEF